ncbi:PRC-barrel domain-containing protein [Pseudanabaenaceae cyanobacterium LEGE 13415]|nr:PRC-barrel domain-containing protein [Pseudanabaenaceae cyanobacterium LEGE 13415]
MALLKVSDFNPDYHHIFGDRDIIDFSVYSDDREKIGTVENILVDQQTGEFRYLIVDIGFWIFGKSVLLPIGRARIQFDEQRVYAKGLTKEQAEHLSEFTDDLEIDSAYEERVRSGFQRPVNRDGYGNPLPQDSPSNLITPPVERDGYGNPITPSAPYAPSALNEIAILSTPQPQGNDYISELADETSQRDLFRYEDHPDLYSINEVEHPSIRAYSDRLVNQFRHENH